MLPITHTHRERTVQCVLGTKRLGNEKSTNQLNGFLAHCFGAGIWFLKPFPIAFRACLCIVMHVHNASMRVHVVQCESMRLLVKNKSIAAVNADALGRKFAKVAVNEA